MVKLCTKRVTLKLWNTVEITGRDKFMKEYVSIGKNVNIAIEEGLRTLGLEREDVDIKILETGGLFKKAKVFRKNADIHITADKTSERKT